VGNNISNPQGQKPLPATKWRKEKRKGGKIFVVALRRLKKSALALSISCFIFSEIPNRHEFLI